MILSSSTVHILCPPGSYSDSWKEVCEAGGRRAYLLKSPQRKAQMSWVASSESLPVSIVCTCLFTLKGGELLDQPGSTVLLRPCVQTDPLDILTRFML